MDRRIWLRKRHYYLSLSGHIYRCSYTSSIPICTEPVELSVFMAELHVTDTTFELDLENDKLV